MSDNQAIPDGLVLQHTLYGEPAGRVTHAWTAAPNGVEVIQAPYSGVPWNGIEDEIGPYVTPENERTPDRIGRCWANNDSCMGKTMRDSKFCPPHAGVLKGRGHKASHAPTPPVVGDEPAESSREISEESE